MNRTPAERALIVDIGSIHRQLTRWRHRGEFAAADELLRHFSEDPDRWLRAVGLGRPEATPLSLRDFDLRVLLLTRTKAWSANDKFFDHIDDVARSDTDYRSAVNRFERRGFRPIVSTASPSLQVSIELMNLSRDSALPSEVVIATASPEVSDLLPTLRSFGVRTSVVAVFGKDDTARISDVVDAVVDLMELAEALGQDIRRGFDIRDRSNREKVFESVCEILSDDTDDAAGTVALDGLREELTRQSPDLRSILPREDGGLRELLETMFNDHRDDPVLSRYRITDELLVPLETLRDVADEIERIAARATQDPRRPDRIDMSYLSNELQRMLTAGGLTLWLGYEKFSQLLWAALKTVQWGRDWQVDADDSGFVVVPPGTLAAAGSVPEPRSAGSEDDRSQKLRAVARYVDGRLRNARFALTLVELANDTPTEIEGVNASTGWLGYRTFLSLLRAAKQVWPDADWIFETQVSPGYLRRKDQRIPSTFDATIATGRAEPAATIRSETLDLRRAIPEFPRGTVNELRRKIAVLATVLASSSALTLQKERIGITKAVQLEGRDSGLAGGRSSYAPLVRAARLPVGDASGWSTVFGVTAYVGERDAALMLTGVGREISIDPHRPELPPGGLVRLHELMSNQLTSYFMERESVEESVARDLIRRVLGPVPTNVTGVDRIVELYREFLEGRVAAVPDQPEALLDLMRTLQSDRDLYLVEPAGVEDPDAARRDIERYADGRLTDADGRIPIDELFHDYVNADTYPVGDIATFVGLLSETIDRRESSDEASWSIDREVPPGSFGFSVATTGDRPPQSAAEQWLDLSREFTRFALRRSDVVVSWPEASHAIAREHGLFG